MNQENLLALLPGYRATRTEYWTTGSRDEPEGLTLMTRSVFVDDGTPHIQMAGGPEHWYKPQQITKEQYDALADEMRSMTTPKANFGLATPDNARTLQQQAIDASVQRWLTDNRILIKRAKKDAAELGETLEACLVEASAEFKNAPTAIRSAILAVADTM